MRLLFAAFEVARKDATSHPTEVIITLDLASKRISYSSIFP